MPIPKDSAAEAHGDRARVERLRAAIESLEAIVADRGVLAQLSAEERRRLIVAAGRVYTPDR